MYAFNIHVIAIVSVVIAIVSSTYHTPPQSISIAAKLCETTIIHCILLCQVHEVGREDEPKESNIKSCDQFLETGDTVTLYNVKNNNSSIIFCSFSTG